MSKDGSKGMGAVLEKVKMGKKTKEATSLNESYEPTKTALQFWQMTTDELERRRVEYAANIEAFQAKGGDAKGIEDDLIDRV